MKKIFLLIVMCAAFQLADAQNITARVVSSANGKPLPFAIVLYNSQKNITYSDENGFFYLEKDSLHSSDSVLIQFLGYRNLVIGVRDLKDKAVFKMIEEPPSLKPVVVSNCAKTKEYMINKRVGRIKQFIGPGPETKLVIISKYNNRQNKEGYVNSVQIYIDETPEKLKVPLRFRWYEWDSSNNRPGHELTDTSILVYPYKNGWNEFQLPARTLFCSLAGIVFGLEFIYPAEYEQHYKTIKSTDEKIKWLNDMQNRWSLGMQVTNDVTQRSFYIISNRPLNEYTGKSFEEYVRPAIKFTFTACKK